MAKKQKHQQAMQGVKLINRVTGEEYLGDILGDDSIDGKPFWIVQVNGRAFKLAKEGYNLKRQGR